MGMRVTANVARDGRTSKQQCDLVVKREKLKTHEAQTTSIGRYSNSRGGPVLRARPRMMTKTFWGAPTSRETKTTPRLRTSWHMLRLTAASN